MWHRVTASDIFASEDAALTKRQGRSSDFRIILPGYLPSLASRYLTWRSKPVVYSRFVPGYSGGPVTVFHRLPLTPIANHILLSDRIIHHSRIPRVLAWYSISSE